MKKVVILGSTGSIGTQTLEVVRRFPREFKVIGISAYKNKKLFKEQIREFEPQYAVQSAQAENFGKQLCELATLPQADLIVNALGGTSGLMPTYAAVSAGKFVALANKESMVMAGELLMKTAAKTVSNSINRRAAFRAAGAQIIPIDSEISALWQMLRREHGATGNRHIKKVILTASGGPFLGWPEEKLKDVTPAQALKHPTWKMGAKISIDSATLMNKAFEIIETSFLFGIAPEKIEVVIHPQSVVHALVEFSDGNIQAILSPPDMRIPISYALFYPERAAEVPQGSELDFSKLNLNFEKPATPFSEALELAGDVLRAGGIMPALLCKADEVAVSKFLDGEISFLEIIPYIKNSLRQAKNIELSYAALQGIIGA